MVNVSTWTCLSVCGSLFWAIWLMLAPIVAVTASLFVWTGFWNILTSYYDGELIGYNILYASIGFALISITGTFLAQAGVQPVRYAPAKDFHHNSPLLDKHNQSSTYLSAIDNIFYFVSTQQSSRATTTTTTTTTTISTEPTPSLHHSSLKHKIAIYLRATIAMFAGILLWLGVYNILDLHIYADSDLLWLRHVVYISIGLLLMLISGTFISESDVTLSDITVIESRGGMLLYYLKALTGLSGSIIYWVGAYNTVDVHLGESSKLRDSIYIVVGFFALIATQLLGRLAVCFHTRNRNTKSFYEGEHYAIPISETGNRISSISSIESPFVRFIIAIRILLSMIAGVFYWVGWWNILTYYIIESNEEEDVSSDVDPVADSNQQSRKLLRNVFHLYSRTLLTEDVDGGSDSSFPLYALYIIFTFGGLFILICTGGLLGSGGVLQPVALTRANVRKSEVAPLSSHHDQNHVADDFSKPTLELITDEDTVTRFNSHY